MINKLLLLTKENDIYRQLLLQSNLPNLTIVGDAPDSIAHANIWLAEPALAAPLLNHATNLQWMQSTFAGVDKLIGSRMRTDYHLTNIKGIFGPLMSEYLFGYLLAHQREHQQYKLQQRQKQWLPRSYKTLQGQVLLILGTGSIAQHIAKTASHFGMTVIGVNQTGHKTTGFDKVVTLTHLAENLMNADVIASILPSTPHTQNLLNQQTLSLLKPSAILFNLGRGDVLDLAALSTQLNDNPQQQAILDVFNQEPLPQDHPIWNCENVVVTPHIAAPSFPEQVVELFCKNYNLWLNNKGLNCKVDFSKGY
ncbi:D-2-hydroxyacid dehydrogenase [Shewanella gaetbuli]|uniref:D-2-hydroxyacid dehydrogenase n=1 Tax=Shewanella gaetbuli TaxID=220752 RepID=A0A9X1ZN85_9GAMM|nr:D-2-hydroxyacid dehydrogenase [Shewanella gaetbuli]MCL1144072.1 D-2-hydroxyacid dehydrogenase [Shewanella gaetbuli]